MYRILGLMGIVQSLQSTTDIQREHGKSQRNLHDRINHKDCDRAHEKEFVALQPRLLVYQTRLHVRYLFHSVFVEFAHFARIVFYRAQRLYVYTKIYILVYVMSDVCVYAAHTYNHHLALHKTRPYKDCTLDAPYKWPGLVTSQELGTSNAAKGRVPASNSIRHR